MLNRDSLPAASRPSIRRAGAEELLRLWRGRSGGNTPPTAVFFADHIRHENAEFWALERSGELIGISVTIKECRLDPCFMDEEMRPRACPCFLLLSKTL